jgi:hypothetical protein
MDSILSDGRGHVLAKAIGPLLRPPQGHNHDHDVTSHLGRPRNIRKIINV